MIEEFKKANASKLWLSMFILFLVIIDISCVGAKSLKKGDEYRIAPETGNGIIKVVSSDEVEIVRGNTIFLGKYTIDGERVKVVANQSANLVEYYKITPDGLVEEKDGTIYYSKAVFDALEEKKKRVEDEKSAAEFAEFLAKGGDVNAKDNWGRPTIVAAAGHGKTELVKVLLSNSVAVNAKDKDGTTAVMYAADMGNTEIVKMLIDKKADVNAKDDNGNAALIFAVGHNYSEIVRMLLENGANANEKNGYGVSVLAQAVLNMNIEIVKMILEKGGDASIKDGSGKTVFDYTQDHKMLETLNKYAAQNK